MQPLITLEMNEVNFDYIQTYIQKGHLKHFEQFFTKHGFCKTTSETGYEILEPWIQWVSARTGQTYSEHQVFRLGDIVSSDVEQHWEKLENQGWTVAAVSPINAVNRTQNSPFWIPDPWVETPASGGEFQQSLAAAVGQAVNDNASETLSYATKKTLARAMLSKTKFSSWPCYLGGLFGVLKKQHWSKAVVLDRLLADVFFKMWGEHKPDFSTLFLNSAAHIQHHYMCNSKAYGGNQKNPSWYVRPEADPVLEIYELYDAILGEAVKLGARVMVATGLKQVPYEEITFYYRLVRHEEFLKKLRISFKRILPRMSRDFLVECESESAAISTSEALLNLKAGDGMDLFAVDNRGDTLFVTLCYPHEIKPGFKLFDQAGAEVLPDFAKDVAFVAIKNGHHDAVGYFMDTAFKQGELPNGFPLEDMFNRVMGHFEGAGAVSNEQAYGGTVVGVGHSELATRAS